MTDINLLAERLCMHQYEHLREYACLQGMISGQGEDGIIICLMVSGGEMLPGELAEKTGLTSGRIANILKQLEKKRLVERNQDHGDRRKVNVHLTAEGQKLGEEMMAQSVGNIRKLLEYLGDDDASELERLIFRCCGYAEE